MMDVSIKKMLKTDQNTTKLAIVFPGIGYHVDKPLLFHARKLLREHNYEIIDANYSGFPSGIKGNPQKMRDAFDMALIQAEDFLKGIDIGSYNDVIFVSKSIGTAVAAAYAKKHKIKAKHIYFTPIAETFEFVEPESGIAFHGTADPWVDTEIVTGKCADFNIPLHITAGANHSLEIGDVLKDIQELYQIIDTIRQYIFGEEAKKWLKN